MRLGHGDRRPLGCLVAIATAVALLPGGPAPRADAAAPAAAGPGDGVRTERVTTATVVDQPGSLSTLQRRSYSWSGDEAITWRSYDARPGRGEQLQVRLEGDPQEGNQRFDWDLAFTAGAGDLVPGRTYTDPNLPGYEHDNLGGIELTVGHSSCAATGEFTVHEIDLAEDRFWITAVIRCWKHGDARALLEIRRNVETRTADGVVAPAVVDWPEYEVRETYGGDPLELQNTGTRTVRLGRPYVTGPHAGDWTVRGRCAELAPGETCRVPVEFRPRGAGQRRAVLRWPTARGGELTTRMSGSAVGGITRGLRRYISHLGGDTFRPGPSHHWYGAGDGYEGVFVGGHAFDAPGDQRLEPGYYPDAQRYPFNDDAPGLGDVPECGDESKTVRASFHVSEATYDEAGNIASFAASWDIRCRGWEARRGYVAWRASELPPYPLVRPRVRITRAPRAVRHGNRVRIQATVPQWLMGVVRLQARPVGTSRWRSVGTQLTTNMLQGAQAEDDQAEFRTGRIRRSTRFRVRLVGEPWRTGGDATTILVRPRVTLSLWGHQQRRQGTSVYGPRNRAKGRVTVAPGPRRKVRARLQIRTSDGYRGVRPGRLAPRRGGLRWVSPRLRPGRDYRVKMVRPTPNAGTASSGWSFFRVRGR